MCWVKKFLLQPNWPSSEFVSSNYFQIGQHVVLLHTLMFPKTLTFVKILRYVWYFNTFFNHGNVVKQGLFLSKKSTVPEIRNIWRWRISVSLPTATSGTWLKLKSKIFPPRRSSLSNTHTFVSLVFLTSA